MALYFFQQLCNLPPFSILPILPILSILGWSSFLPFCLLKRMPWKCIVNRKKFIRCLYNNSTPLQSEYFQKQRSIFPLDSSHRRVSDRVQRHCFLSLMSWIRSLDKTLLVLNICQRKITGIMGFVQHICFRHTAFIFPLSLSSL